MPRLFLDQIGKASRSVARAKLQTRRIDRRPATSSSPVVLYRRPQHAVSQAYDLKMRRLLTRKPSSARSATWAFPSREMRVIMTARFRSVATIAFFLPPRTTSVALPTRATSSSVAIKLRLIIGLTPGMLVSGELSHRACGFAPRSIVLRASWS
jgi:hypothetical protein